MHNINNNNSNSNKITSILKLKLINKTVFKDCGNKTMNIANGQCHYVPHSIGERGDERFQGTLGSYLWHPVPPD